MGEGLIRREIERARKAQAGGRGQSGLWHSPRWWRFHHAVTDECGAYSDWEHAEACHNGAGRQKRAGWVVNTVERRRSKRTPAAAAQRADFDAYLDERYNAASAATNGVMLSARGKARGVDSRRFFTASRVDQGAASDELRDWFRANGPVMTAKEHAAAHGTGGAVARRDHWWETDARRAEGSRFGLGAGWRP